MVFPGSVVGFMEDGFRDRKKKVERDPQGALGPKSPRMLTV